MSEQQNELIRRIELFFQSPWKELSTCSILREQLLKHKRELGDQNLVNAYSLRLSRLRMTIIELTPGINPSVCVVGTVLLPRVAWLPAPVVDEETGIAVTPSMPSIPEGLTKAELCYWKKRQADAFLDGNNETQPGKPDSYTTENVEKTTRRRSRRNS